MKKLALIVILLLACLAAWGSSPAAEERPVVFTHALIIDGNGGAPIEDGTVVVRGTRIEAVGRAADVPVPAKARVIDVRGKVVMPGLADMHLHLLGGWDGESVEMLGFRRYLNSLLYCGVTTVLDAGNVKPFIIQMRAEIAAGRLLGPRVYCAGPIIDGPDPLWPPISYSLVSAEQVPKMVKELKQDRVDFLKGYNGLSIPMVSVLAAEGRKAGLPLLVDQSWRNGSPELAAAGAAVFAHTPDFVWGAEAVGLLKSRGVKFISTLAVTESKCLRRLEDLAFLGGALIKETTPPDFILDLKAYARKTLESPDWSKGPKQSKLERFRRQVVNLKKLYDAGLLFAAGTDAPYPGVFQGEGIHHELELLVEAGLKPMEALALATRNAAQLVGAEKEWGTLAAGLLANILVINGRPDLRIGESRNIDLVMREGKVLDRAKLRFDPATDPGYHTVAPIIAEK